ncbi:hypothetical protein Tco_0487373 [Tanacetum coccineum]
MQRKGRYAVLEGSDTAYWVTWHGLHDYNILEYSSSASLYGVLDILDMAYWMTPKATRTPNYADVIQKKRKGKQVVGETSSPRKSLKITIKQQNIKPTTPLPLSDDRERDEIHEATHLSFALHKIIKIHEEQQNVVAVKEHLLAKDVEKIVKGKESDGTEFADSVFLSDDEDSGSLEIRTKKMQTPIPSPPRSPRKDLSLDKAIAQELMVSVSLTPASSSQDHSKLNSNKCKILPRSIAQMSRRRGQLRKQTNRTFVINNYFQDKMKEMNETIHNTVPELTVSTKNDLIKESLLRMVNDAVKQDRESSLAIDVLKAKFKRFLASAGSCRDDAFRKRDHDEHQGDYGPPEGEKKRQQQQQEWDAWVEDPVIDEDEVILDDETPEIIEEIVKVVRVTTEQQHRLHYMDQIIVMRENDKPDSFSKADFKYLNKNNIEDMYYLCRNKKLGIKSYQIKINLTAPTLIFLGIEECEPFSIVDKPTTGLIYLNNKNEKRFMDLEELPHFCDSTLEKVLKEVNMKIFETEFLKKAPLLGSLDLIIMKAYEREIKKRLSHREHMRR